MPLFSYTALTREGNLVKGEGEFQSLEELFYSLQRDGSTLVDYKIKKSTSFTLFKRKIKRTELAEFLHQLAFLMRSGIPLITALDDLEKETRNKFFKANINKLKVALSRGETFSSAMAQLKIFPKVVISLITIGEESGTLDKTLEEASQHLYRIEEIISQTKRAMIYPSFIFSLMMLALAFWFFYVLPKILTLFKEMDVKLPLPTIILIKVVDFLTNYKLWILLLFISLPIAFYFFYRHPRSEILADKILLRLPLYGRVRRLNFLAFFFEHFSLLLSSGIDLLRLLKLMKEAFYRRYFINIVQRIENDILAGETIAASLKKEPIFRPIDIRMVAVGESTGRLDEQMKILSKFYYEEVQNILTTLTKILEPVILVIAGLIFFIIIVALIGPIYELISQMGKVY